MNPEDRLIAKQEIPSVRLDAMCDSRWIGKFDLTIYFHYQSVDR